MAGFEALQVALALHQRPVLVTELRRRSLPPDVGLVLKLAAGQQAAIAEAGAGTGFPPDALVDASRFFVEQLLLSRECESDPWRVLGVAPGADPGLLREHRRLLMTLVHPDRGEDWAAAYSDRVNRAWRQLKSPEGREAALRSTVGKGEAPPSPDGWGTPIEVDAPAPASSVRRDLSDLQPHAGHLLTVPPGPMVTPRDGEPGSRMWRVLVSCGIAVIGVLVWSSMDSEWKGAEVLVSTDRGVLPIADSPAPIAPDAAAAPTVPSSSAGGPSAPSAADSAPFDSGQRVGRAAALTAVESGEQSSAADPPPIGVESSTQASRNTAIADPILITAQRPDAGTQLPQPAEAHALPPTEVGSSPTVPSGTVAIDPGQSSARIAERASPRLRDLASVPPREVAVAPPAAGGRGPGRTADAPVDRSDHAGSRVENVPAAREAPDAAARVLADSTASVPEATSTASALALLDEFSRHYASGDLSALVGLFSRGANSARGGAMALAADYARLFDETSQREIRLSDVKWKLDGDSIRGEGRFDARYYAKGRLFRQRVQGEISFVMVREAGALRFLRLDSRPDRGGA